MTTLYQPVRFTVFSTRSLAVRVSGSLSEDAKANNNPLLQGSGKYQPKTLSKHLEQHTAFGSMPQKALCLGLLLIFMKGCSWTSSNPHYPSPLWDASGLKPPRSARKLSGSRGFYAEMPGGWKTHLMCLTCRQQKASSAPEKRAWNPLVRSRGYKAGSLLV